MHTLEEQNHPNDTLIPLKKEKQPAVDVCKEDHDNSHDEDGSGDEWGSVETSLTVSVLSLSLVHLPSTVLTASTHTEAHANDGCEDHKQDADCPTYEKSRLVVRPLPGDKSRTVLNLRDIVVKCVKFEETVMSLPAATGPRSPAENTPARAEEQASIPVHRRTHRQSRRITVEQNKVREANKRLLGCRIPISFEGSEGNIKGQQENKGFLKKVHSHFQRIRVPKGLVNNVVGPQHRQIIFTAVCQEYFNIQNNKS